MLIVEEEGGRRRPEVRCQHCGERVEPDREGRAVWEPGAEVGSPYHEARFVHAGCLDGYAEAAGADLASAPLGAFLRDLAANLKITTGEV